MGQHASVAHRLTADDAPSAADIREVLGAFDDADWQMLADPPGRLPRIRVLHGPQPPAGATLRHWYFSAASEDKLAGQLSYYTYALWKTFGATAELSPPDLTADEPSPKAVEDFLRLSEQHLGHIGPRMAYLGLASRYGTGSAAAQAGWRMIEPMQLLAPAGAGNVLATADLGEVGGAGAPDPWQQLTLGDDLPDTAPSSEGSTTPEYPDSDSPIESGTAAPAVDASADGPESPDVGLTAIDPADAAAIAAHDESTEAVRRRLTALLDDARERTPHAHAAAESAVEMVAHGRAVPPDERAELDDWGTSIAQATRAIRDATGLAPREEVASLNAAVQTWLRHRDDVGQAMREAAINRTTIDRLRARQAHRRSNLAAIDRACAGASPQVRQALGPGLASAQHEVAAVEAQLDQAVALQGQLDARIAAAPVLPADAAVPLDPPEPEPVPAAPGAEATTAHEESATGRTSGVPAWYVVWSALLLLGSLALGFAIGTSVGMDRLAWSMAALTWWALIGPVIVVNLAPRWRWTAAVGLAAVAAIFATWAYQSAAVCGMTSAVAALVAVPVGLVLTAVAVWWQARAGGQRRTDPVPWWLAVAWFAIAFSLVFLMSVLTTPITCAVG